MLSEQGIKARLRWSAPGVLHRGKHRTRADFSSPHSTFDPLEREGLNDNQEKSLGVTVKKAKSYGTTLRCSFSPVLIYAFYWGNRDFNVGSDTVTYVALFRAYLLRSPGLLSTGDPGFLALMGAVETFTHNPSALLLAFCVLIALFFYVAGVLVIKKAQYILLYVVLLLISLTTFPSTLTFYDMV
ncbi:EpsG family protein [Deinococcus malanensis]|uniref:EpsG family protein n=1 Tax=Deinococcus malanensis TaxID=1706855 RepID=UPI00363C315A